MNSVSVISRAYDAEAPYIKSFIEHYTSIGCSEFHIVIPKGNPYKHLKIVCDKYSQVKLYIDYPDNNSLRGSQSVPLPYITTSHIISVDIDEYLNVQDIIPLLEHEYTRLNWVIAPYSAILNPEKIPGFIDKQCKYIVKTILCESMDDHDCTLNKKVMPYELDNKLLHYVYRSFNDLFLKCSMSNYGDYQASKKNSFLKGLDDVKKLPHKFKMAAIYQRIASASKTKYPVLYNIDLSIEQELINKTLHFSNINNLHNSLLHYSSLIDLKYFIKKMLQHKAYKERKRIPHSVLAEISDTCLLEELDTKKWISIKNYKNFSFMNFNHK